MHSLGRQWIKQMTLSAVLFPLLVCGTAIMINFIAIYYHASRAIPFATMVSSLTLILLYNIDALSNNRSQEYMYIVLVVTVSSTTFSLCLNAVMNTCTGKESEMYIQKCNFGLWATPWREKKCCNYSSMYMYIDV